jgi:hypothetical protein
MPDPVETAIRNAADRPTLSLPTSAVAVITTLTIYGGVSMVHDVTRFAKHKFAVRKAVKEAAQAKAETTE